MRLPLAVAALAGLVLPRAALAQNPAVTVNVNATANRRAIADDVYGLAFAAPSVLADLRISLNRWGGNPTTRYNWQLNADNRGADWYFQSIAYGERHSRRRSGRRSSRRAARGGAEPMMTIPMVGWVAKVGPNRGKLASFSIAKYGPQQDDDWQWIPGRRQRRPRPTAQFVTGNDPSDANLPADAAFQQGWFSTWWTAGARPPTAACATTSSTTSPASGTRRIATCIPRAPTMEEVRDKIDRLRVRDQGRRSGRQGRGPGGVGLDRLLLQRLRPAIRRRTRLGIPARTAPPTATRTTCPGSSTSSAQAEVATGQRLLDVFTVHYYPQGGEFGNDTSTRHAAPPQPLHALAVGPELRRRDLDQRQGAADSAAARMGEHALPRHADRHHRIQLGRRGPHQRRHRAGRRPGHLRPRGPRPGRALDDARPGVAHLQGHQDVPQLRRPRLRLRRDQRRRGRARTPTTLSAFAAVALVATARSR